jgi:colanic acid biosynthesis glycosyl transferase WcaI
MRILVLNQYAPPDPAPTAKLIGQLAERLRAAEHEVMIIGTGQGYRRKRSTSERRLFREFKALARLFYEGLCAERTDVLLSTSSPPGLFVIATILSVLKRAKSAHWSFDLYPELALALGKPLPRWVERFLYSATRTCYRRADAVVALDEDMQSHIEKTYGIYPEVIQPWLLTQPTAIKVSYPSNKEFIWLYSGNLGRAHEWMTLLEAQHTLENRGLNIKLVFQGGGPQWIEAQEFARNLKLTQIEWRPYAPEDELVESLLAAHVLIVTQKPVTQGLLWPSKLSLVMTLPRPIIFVGPKEGAIARQLSGKSASAIFAPGESSALADHVAQVCYAWPPNDDPKIQPGFSLEQAFPRWLELLKTIAP